MHKNIPLYHSAQGKNKEIPQVLSRKHAKGEMQFVPNYYTLPTSSLVVLGFWHIQLRIKAAHKASVSTKEAVLQLSVQCTCKCVDSRDVACKPLHLYVQLLQAAMDSAQTVSRKSTAYSSTTGQRPLVKVKRCHLPHLIFFFFFETTVFLCRRVSEGNATGSHWTFMAWNQKAATSNSEEPLTKMLLHNVCHMQDLWNKRSPVLGIVMRRVWISRLFKCIHKHSCEITAFHHTTGRECRACSAAIVTSPSDSTGHLDQIGHR